MAGSHMRFRFLGLVMAVSVVGSSCGSRETAVPVASPGPVPSSTTSESPGRPALPPSTTLAETIEQGTYPEVDVTDVTLAPDGAFPVIDAITARTAPLDPGTYRVRLDHQTLWPEQCLEELVVFPMPDEGVDLPADAQGGSSDVLRPGWEQYAVAKVNRIRELREPICGDYWAAWEATWPSATESSGLAPLASTTTTIPE